MLETFGELLRYYRVEAGLTQQALAEKARLSEQAIGALERGDRRYPQAVTVDRLVGVLGLTGLRREEFARAAARKGTPRRAVGSTPRQLPADTTHFTGRADQVEIVADIVRDPAAAAVASITGMGGVGKTSLAVHVGHRLAADFPDGQLYVDLQGAHEPVSPLEALGLLLRALGVAGTSVPGTVDEAAARLRTELAGRRVLLVLDNAANSEQVIPLLPGTAGAAAIITSRRALLAVRHARQVHLDVLSEPDAIALLAATAGRERVAAEPDAAVEVVRRCGRLPLAVRLAGTRLAFRTAWPLSYLAERLADDSRRLEELDQHEAGVRACFALSIDGLAASEDSVDRDAAAAYPLLAWPAVPDLSVLVASAVLGLGEDEVDRLLERLAAACLLEVPAPGRYRMHDLLRAYGAGLAVAPARTAVLNRLLDLYSAVAWRGLALSSAAGSPRLMRAPCMTAAPEIADAFGWLDGEQTHLVAVVRQAVADSDVDRALIAGLALGLFEFYRSRGLWRDWRQVCEAALKEPGDRLTHASLLSDLALAEAELAHRGTGDFSVAQQCIRDNIALLEEHGDDDITARALNNACYVYRLSGAIGEAIEFGERGLAMRRCGITMVNLAELYALAGDRVTQHRYLADAIAHLKPLDDAHGMAYALVVQGLVHRADRRFPEAVEALRRSAEQWRRIADAPGEANTLADLGETLLAAGEPDAAREVLERALALLRRLGDPVREKRVVELLQSDDNCVGEL
ncbi:tetratricopeptide repeat protein [Lentzea sp. CC55]|uniref:ATP-binding protein n=1 Tax=Lentzea sp. CC55 TaxID=2884909 RepID=UPI0027E000EA|nr:helix-turn-helix domain-containing protein [Lentzea sp. CC55]MCG8927446.1 tetratricopeptide repeat protein [Lentzea sp. CC55]